MFLAVTLPVFVGALVAGFAVVGGVWGALDPDPGRSRGRSALIGFVVGGLFCAAIAAVTLVLPALE